MLPNISIKQQLIFIRLAKTYFPTLIQLYMTIKRSSEFKELKRYCKVCGLTADFINNYLNSVIDARSVLNTFADLAIGDNVLSKIATIL